jgi:hypothetical protein
VSCTFLDKDKQETFRNRTSSEEGSIQPSDCTACAPGYLCDSIELTYEKCPAGYYCPVQENPAFPKRELYPCPTGTWSPRTGLLGHSECETCPAGYVCGAPATSELADADLCPVGHYCPTGASAAVPCPAGRYRNATGGEDVYDCTRCPAGFFCPRGASAPIECYDGTYCTDGAATYRTVPAGSYSNTETTYQARACPRNHKCPRGAKAPERCTGRAICPAGSPKGRLCPAGSYVRRSNAYGATDECLPCPPGKYSILLPSEFNTLESTTCQPCEPGYLCYGNTSR